MSAIFRNSSDNGSLIGHLSVTMVILSSFGPWTWLSMPNLTHDIWSKFKKFHKKSYQKLQRILSKIFLTKTLFSKTFLWYVGESVRFSSFRHELSLESWFLFQNFQRWNFLFFRSTLDDFFSGSPKIRSSGSLNLTSGWFFVFMLTSSSKFSSNSSKYSIFLHVILYFS